jgi:hypothetical protein
MLSQLLSEDIINAIDTLQEHLQTKYNRKKEEPGEHYIPISRIIRPEWHYSEISREFENVDINWYNLENFQFIRSMAENLDNVNVEVYVGSEFEMSSAAWYQPYHYLPRTAWGIHIRYDSWLRIAAKLYRSCHSLISRSVDSVKAAFLYLFNHALFHYITENASSVLEILSGNPSLYTNYQFNLYSKLFNSTDCLEETLANSYLFEKAEQCHIDKQYLREELSSQAKGYKQFVNYLGSNFRNGSRRLISQIQKGLTNPPFDDPLEQILDISNPMDYAHGHRVPIWLRLKAKPVHQFKL